MSYDGDKKGFAIAIGLPKGSGKKSPPYGGGDSEPDGDESDGGEGREQAGMDFADAIKSGDGAAIADAFAALRDLA